MRSRNLKPGFFKNEELAELDPLARLLFQGLWLMADREGRLEDRPKRIKVEVLPYDSVNIDKFLNLLNERHFIIRYSINGSKFIQIANFIKHQSPHVKEPESLIPAPDNSGTSTGQEPVEQVSSIYSNGESGISNGESGIKKSGRRAPDKKVEHPLPPDFDISDSIRRWAKEKGYTDLEAHLEWFKDWATAGGKRKVDWDATFRNCIRGNWAKIAGPGPPNQPKGFSGLRAWAAKQEDL